MTKEEKATIIGNAHLEHKEARETKALLQVRASGYAKILKQVADALDRGLRCQHSDGRLCFGGNRGGFERFGVELDYPTPDQIHDVLCEIQEQEKRLSDAESTLKKIGL